jgi:hypothetical protein
VGRFEVLGMTGTVDVRVDVDANETDDGKEEDVVDGGSGTSAGSVGSDEDVSAVLLDCGTTGEGSGGTYPRRMATPPLLPLEALHEYFLVIKPNISLPSCP